MARTLWTNNDDNLRYRDETEIKFWKDNDPIEKTESNLNQEEIKNYHLFCKNLKKRLMMLLNLHLNLVHQK